MLKTLNYRVRRRPNPSVAVTHSLAEDGLFEIIDACPLLDTLNLTSCRRVKVTDRRRFFDVWKAARLESEDSADERNG
jgi:hypothetical protein